MAPAPTARFCGHICAALWIAEQRRKAGRKRTPCIVEGCDRQRHSQQGWCLMHYKRWRRTGSPDTVRHVRRPAGTSLTEWFWQQVDKTPTCWIWRGYVNAQRGYGYLWDGERKVTAHAFLVGSAGRGKEWHHTCRNRLCVRPDHLERLTTSAHRREHARDAVTR